MKTVAQYLRENYGPWGWMSQRAHDAVGINRVLPLDFIISCSYGTDVPLYFREEDVYSVEKENGVRRDWSNEDLNVSLKGRLGKSIFKRWSGEVGRVDLLCYRSVKKLEDYQKAFPRKLKIHSSPVKLKRKFDNKIFLCRNLKKLGIASLEYRVGRLWDMSFRNLEAALSSPFVVQFPYGSSGLTTFIIHNDAEYVALSARCPHQMVSVRTYVDGYSLNVNGVILSTAKGPVTYCAFPSVQMTGIKECGNLPKAFCGNDYASACRLEKNILRQTERIMRTTGGWMAEHGFRGMFGMDLIVKGDVVYPIEINPRFQNSTSLYTTLESMQTKRTSSLFLLHVAEFLQKKDAFLREYVERCNPAELMRPFEGSQIIVHNRMKRNVAKGELKPGAYKLKGDTLKFRKETASLAECAKDDILVTCAVPAPDTLIEPNAPICKIQSLSGALDESNRTELSGRMKKAVKCVYDILVLEEAKEAIKDVRIAA